MKSRNSILLIVIISLALVAIYIVIPSSPGLHIDLGPIQVDRDFEIKQGLDLQGGLQVLLVALFQCAGFAMLALNLVFRFGQAALELA